MTTFTSALSLLVLLLATGCFTLPIIQEKFSDSTISPFHDFTTSKTNENKVVSFHMRLVPDDETSDLPELPEERSLDNDWNIRTSTFANIPTPKDNSVRRPRTFDDLHSSEPFTFTTEHSFHERDFMFDNAELNTEATEHERRSVTIEHETENETESEGESDKRDFLELTTSYLPSFTSTSSDVAPKFYTSEPSTEKYIGHLKNELEEGEKVKDSKKITKSEVYPEEDSKELHIPQAQLDQKALDLAHNVPNYVMHLEHNNEVVTDIPERFLTTTILYKKEEEREDKPEPAREPKFEHEDKYETKHDDKDETKREDKDETKRDDKDEIKREDKDETKREDKDETKRDDKDETKREDKDETKREDKDETKLDDKDETKREDKPEKKREEPKHVHEEHRLLNQGKEPLFHEEAKPDF